MEEGGRVSLALAKDGDSGRPDEGLLQSFKRKCLRMFRGDQHKHPEHSEAQISQAGQAAVQIPP